MATVYEFNYTGSEQRATLKPGKYKLECWGACGGRYKADDFTTCAKGGYAKGEIILKEKTNFRICVGQSGYEKVLSTSSFTRTGYNGGGAGGYSNFAPYKWSFDGGGSTDIRLSSGNSSWDDLEGLLSRILIAGGGGGASESSVSKLGHGGGLNGDNGIGYQGNFAGGGTQYQGGINNSSDFDGLFGKGGSYNKHIGGGGGWFGGAGCVTTQSAAGGGSGYALTKDSYKPPGYIPTSEYWLENVVMTTGGNTTRADGYAKITLLQALPFLNISSYNSTTATFKADHTDPTLLTKIEYFIDDVLKETITTDLTLEKTINYTLEDNTLHTLKIVVTDSANATAEKVVSISKNIMPLEDGASLQDIATKVSEMKDGLKSGKRSIVNVLTLKDIDASLNNTFVELSEKVKDYFDNADYFFQEANKGKELIATTIGSPATKENTYQELSSYITEFKNTIGTLTTQLESANNKLTDPYITKVNNRGVPSTFTVDFRMYYPSSSFTRRSTCIYVDATFIHYTTPGDMSTGVHKSVKYVKTDTKDLNGYRIFYDGDGTLSLTYENNSVRVVIQGGYTSSPGRKKSDVYSYNVRMVNTYWD
ncbi:glycine rich domain-containing protein [Clostridioides difficile]|uniref:glycine rich domain-containing protein n=1 Tax=Clostridioides difficile TaxID=1496 RepID=UPI001033F755|nr:glycine rich domain-containing protein [Clostridioides difficile]